MKKALNAPILLLLATFCFTGCLKEEAPQRPTVDYGGTTSYRIVNNSNRNLKVIYRIAPAPIDKDSTVSIPAHSKTEIFKYGGLGGVFFPSYIFGNLTFYDKSGIGDSIPLLKIEPVVDDKWIKSAKEGDSEVKYELEITSDDLQ